MSFFVDLWNSVFTPGTTPTLILATHVTFAFLVSTLSMFVFLSRSYHLVNLLVISLLLWVTLTWFINELEKEKLKEKEGSESERQMDSVSDGKTTQFNGKPTALNTNKRTKSRKI